MDKLIRRIKELFCNELTKDEALLLVDILCKNWDWIQVECNNYERVMLSDAYDKLIKMSGIEEEETDDYE